MTISSLLLYGVYRVFIQSLNAVYIAGNELTASRDIRTVISELSLETRKGSSFVVLESYTDRTYRGPTESGDCLVIFYENNDQEIYKVVGFYRADLSYSGYDSAFKSRLDSLTSSFEFGENEQPVFKFEKEYTTPISTDSAITLPTLADMVDDKLIVEISKGLSNEKLFYNLDNRSFIVRGQISRPGRVFYQKSKSISTYNFTLSTRG